MRPERWLLAAVVCLGWGLGIIFGFAKGTAGIAEAWPLSGSSLHICTTTTGGGVLGGFALTLLGTLLLLWATLAAVVSECRYLFRRKPQAVPVATEPVVKPGETS